MGGDGWEERKWVGIWVVSSGGWECGKRFGRFKAYSTHQVGGDMVGRRGRWVGIRVVYGIIISSEVGGDGSKVQFA